MSPTLRPEEGCADIEVPADHGKTETIDGLVYLGDGEKTMLLLTHTSTGADEETRDPPEGNTGFMLSWGFAWNGADRASAPPASTNRCRRSGSILPVTITGCVRGKEDILLFSGVRRPEGGVCLCHRR